MLKDKKIVAGLVLALALGVGYVLTGSCKLTEPHKAAVTAWKTYLVETERRETLAPNLSHYVLSASTTEKSISDQTDAAREAANKSRHEVMATGSELATDKTALDRFQAAQHALGLTLSNLMTTSMKYPKLQSNETFHILSQQLTSLNARVENASAAYNAATHEYNQALDRFPASLCNSLFYRYKAIPEIR